MSVQFGRWTFDGAELGADELEVVRKTLRPFGPDRATSYSRSGVDILYCGFDTAAESRREIEPHRSSRGNMLTWDGRLDNRAELLDELGQALAIDSPDGQIASEAWERWGTDCFRKLAGDWALSIWNPEEQSLVLAKDFLGTRPLYYSADERGVRWSSLLDPLVAFSGRKLALDEEYLAGWLSFFPQAHLTPYRGIHAVPPSSFVRFGRGIKTITRYWDFDPSKTIRYRNDSEYEEQFREIFAQAVRRRLRSDRPILAELSGGADSSSIVSIADYLAAKEVTPRVDTVSYYDDSEPDLNERPFFTVIERKRGQSGCHIDRSFAANPSNPFEVSTGPLAATPASRARPTTRANRKLEAYVTANGHRVLLSGIGGDEVTGGVPTPTPEIQDLLARAKFRTLARQLNAWALVKRKPWPALLGEAMREFLPASFVGVPENRRPAPWLRPLFAHRHQAALEGYECRLSLLGPRPSFEANRNAIEQLRRQLANTPLVSSPLLEKRYPFLDREFLEFLFAIPRSQVVRPGERRSLLRRALRGIVPDEVLDRRRKAFVARAPLAAISREWETLSLLTRDMLSDSLGLIDQRRFSEFLERGHRGEGIPIVPLLRTVYLELWLRHLPLGGRLEPGERAAQCARPFAQPISAEKS